MLPVAKNKNVDSNMEIENTSVDFNTLNYPEKISMHAKQVIKLNGKVIFPVSDYESLSTDFSPMKYFCSTVVSKKLKLY